MLTSSLTAPISIHIGWRYALAAWVILPIIAAIFSLLASLQANKKTPDSSNKTENGISNESKTLQSQHSGIVWMLSIAFFVHLFIYYGITAWLPAYLTQTTNMSSTQAGVAASAFQVLSMIGAFGIPLLAKNTHLAKQLSMMGVLWAIGIVWMLLFPQQWLIWTAITGITQGSCFVVIFSLIMHYAVDLDHNRKLSTAVQGVGYTLASIGPITVGFLHTYSGGWTMPWMGLAASGFILTIAGLVLQRIPEE